MNPTRIYRVADGDNIRLIEATNPAQAIRHCASQRYSIKPASATDVAYLMGKGTKVETAGANDADAAEAETRG